MLFEKLVVFHRSLSLASQTCHHFSFALPAMLLVLAGLSLNQAHQGQAGPRVTVAVGSALDPQHAGAAAATPMLPLQGQEGFTR